MKKKNLTLKNIVPLIKIGKAFREPVSVIEVMHAGEWEHPQYGLIKITDSDIDKFVQSFDNKVRKVDIAVDQEHMPEKGAAGWYKTLKKVFEDGKIKLMATIEWTKLGQQLIKDGVFKYFSPEFDFAYEDQETQEVFENVLLGGGLTNRPYFKSLAPVAFTEDLYAGFTSDKKKGGEKKMLTIKQLKAKLAKDSSFSLSEKASKKQVKLFEEAKAELAKEAEEAKKLAEDKKAKALAKKKKEELEAKKASEKFISNSDHSKQMNELKTRLGVAEKKLRFKEVAAEVDGYVFSESNVDGVLLPKNKKAAVSILMACGEKTAKMFSEFLAELPKISKRLFEEEGSGDEGDGKKDEVAEKAKKLMEDGKAKTYGEAVKIISRENPELVK